MADFLFPYRIRVSARAKNVIIKLIPGKGIEVVLPKGVSKKEVPKFLEKRGDWIDSGIRKLEGKGLSLFPQELVLPEEIFFEASEELLFIYRVKSTRATLRVLRNVDKLILSGSDWTPELEIRALKKVVKSTAKKFLIPELERISKEFNLSFNKVSIRSQRKRWGSCSVKGNINLNMKLMFLPYNLVRYILIHELCHTIHLNHSAKYWRLVKMVEPQYQRLEKELSESGKLVPAWINYEDGWNAEK